MDKAAQRRASGALASSSGASLPLRPKATRRQPGTTRFAGARLAVRTEATSDLQGWASAEGMDWQSLPRSAFAKPDSELRGLLNRIYKASDAVPGRAAQRHRNTPIRGVPVYVMLPLDTVWLLEQEGQAKPVLIRAAAMEAALEMLRAAGVEGIMVDIWWGIVEHAGPRAYDFSAYRRLFDQVVSKGLKIQAVMSFHAAGSNVGDTCRIPLPKWVSQVGDANPDIYYTDRGGCRNRECVSLGCDEEPVLLGRTPLQAYRDFVAAFAREFSDLFGDVITEVTVGLGPAGELRYPSYPEGDGRWRFPGIGEFQCYDRYMLRSLHQAAQAAGRPEWGRSGPHDAGTYNSRSSETGFFRSQQGSWDSEYGAFFLSWYSGQLLAHGNRVLGAADEVLQAHCLPRVAAETRELPDGGTLYRFAPAVRLGVKLAGVHWWYKSRAHAAELTAGYWNTRHRNGYLPLMEMLKRHGAVASFTCVEMRDCEHPLEGRCSPEGLLNQVLATAAHVGVPMSGENALQRYDSYAFAQICASAFGQSVMAGRLEKLTFLRMGDMMVDNWDAFSAFLRRLTCPPEH